MKYLEEKTSNVSILVENQFPDFVQETNDKFLSFVSSYYESQERKYQPLDIALNLVDYYNIGYYRPNRLVQSTVLTETSNLSSTDTTINVESTIGFPDKNGYIEINDEIIFYKEKTNSSFLNCVRGTSALVLKSIPRSDVILTSSTAKEHLNNSVVKNIAYDYAKEFLKRIKSELAPLIPEVLDESLDLANFIKNIKSFYSSKGSLNSHRILFKILFNDKKFNIKLKNRGSGAKLKINNSRGFIVSGGVQIVDGGIGYDNRTESGKLINSPLVDVFGSGTGVIDPVTKLRPNATAIVEVDGIDSNGTITSVNIADPGESYRGPITTRVRNRNFKEDQLVKNVSGTGSGRVEYYDAFTDEVILYDVVGYFLPNEEIFTEDGEKARGFISQSYTTPSLSRNGLEIIGEKQNIEFPKEYTFKTSNAKYNRQQIIKCRLLDGYFLPNDEMPKVVSLIQDEDKIFGVSGVSIEVDNSISLSDRIYQFDIGTNSDIRKIFLPPSTLVTKSLSGISSSTVDFTVTVDEATRFPVTNGIFFVDGREIFYKTRSAHQFFGCSYSGSDTFNLEVKDEVISVARLNQSTEWKTATAVNIGDYVFYDKNYYRAKNSGTTGSDAPTHTSGSKYDGTIVSSQPILWEFVGKNRLDHTFYINFNNSLIENPKFQLLGLPGEIKIEDGGALHSNSIYNFASFDSPNVQAYSFTTSEISDRLSTVLGTNYNRSRDSVIETSSSTTTELNNIKQLPSYKSLTGFSSQYDFGEHIYVAGSGIPRWWDDIVNFNSTLSTEDKKKVAFTNQKLLTRWNKSGLLAQTQAIGLNRKNKKSLGLNIDAIQLNSYRGNTISYGHIEKFFIADGGDYPVVYTENSNGYGYVADTNSVPEFILDDGTKLDYTYNLIKISAGIKSIDFNKLADIWDGTTSTKDNLSGFTTKPRIEVINNNDRNVLSFTSFTGINTTTNQITYTDHGIETLDKVLFLSTKKYFENLVRDTEYFARKIDDNTFTLHKTKSDALLNSNKVDLSYKNVNNPDFIFVTTFRNPPNFRKAKLELSYKNGSIDNIIVRDSGAGYINLPTIRISGGGRIDGNNQWYVDIPFSINGARIIDSSGPLVSNYNYDKDNYNELSVETSNTQGFNTINKLYDINPAVSINFGSGAKAIAYTANGSIVSIVILDQGSGYKLPPKVVITGNGKDAVITTKITNGKLTGFDIVNAGTGYTQSPTLEIISVERKNALVSSKLKEWTFNLVRQLNELDRIDSYGGYVYDSSDSVPSSSSINPKDFKLIDYKNDFPKDLDEKQYYLLQNSKKLYALYLKEKSPQSVIDAAVTAAGKPIGQFNDDEVLQYFVIHALPIAISYDSVPMYGSGYILNERNKPLITDPTNSGYTSQFTTAKSRYKLKYTEVTSGTTGAITLSTTNGTKYVTLDRLGGPSIDQYPIGSFVDDYEYVEGDDDDLDQHNGRFSITPEFPAGRYCYFTTLESYDPITNALVESAAADNDSIGFNGFPYFIGDTFASNYDDYMNNRCRKNDKIPSVFTRSFEKDIDPIVQNGVTIFPGLLHNDEYPQQNVGTSKTVAKTSTISSGSVDSVIIESKGNNYRVGDRLLVDNNLTNGSGFSAIISKVGGKTLTKLERKLENRRVIFTTDSNHGISKNDFVYFEYTKPSTPIEINLPDNSLSQSVDADRAIEISGVTVDQASSSDLFKDVTFYEINLNFRYTYKLNLPANANFQLTYDIEKTNEFFTLEDSPANSVVLNAENIPNRLYLHVGDKIYQINKTRDFYGIQKITETTSNTFTIDFSESTKGYEEVNLSYNVKSFGATGPIEEISITNQGFGYKKLPTITNIIKKGTENETAGDGKAIIQTNSNTIGSLRKLSYSSFGRSFTANRNVNYYLDIPATAKVTKNFEIYEIEVLDGGSNYDNVVTLLVNGKNNLATLEATVYLGTITNVTVVDGGLNFESEPTITVQSTYGSGASLKAKIRRKELYPGVKLTGNVNSLLFPVGVETDVVNFDSRSSTIEFNENVGQFKDGDKIYYAGKVYGEIQSIRRSKAYAKVNAYSELDIQRSNISGNTSETLQKLTDSRYYQEWSYSITSSRDTKDWIKQQDINTHPAGFKQFGKKLIERRKFFFKNPLDVFKSSVIFSTKISRKLDLTLKLSPCGKQRLFLFDVSGFTVGSYIIGATSGAVAKITEITERSLVVENYNNIQFELNEIVVQVSADFAFGKSSATFKSLNFWNGILQEPDESYEVSENPISYVPHYTVDNSDEIVLYTFDDEVIKLDNQKISADQTSFSFTLNNAPYPITSSILNELLITIGGVVQDPSNLSVSNNAIVIPKVGYESNVIAIRHSKLKKLTLTGSGTTYTLNYTPTNDCQLLIFRTGIFQTQLLTDFTVSGNTVTFSESIASGELFGWYFDGTINCEKINGTAINQNKIIKHLPCEKTKFKQFIESNAVKTPDSIYEIRKETLDGTVIPVSSTRVEGFDTKFSYTSPKTSGSYVEVLDQITFNGSTKSFSLKVNQKNYTPKNGEESLVVYINNTVLDHDQYSISGNTITFVSAYSSSTKCTLLDFVSDYSSNTNGENGAIIDRLEVQQNGSRKTFNLSDRGVPKYVNNVGDIFVIKNNELQYPVQTFTDHKYRVFKGHTINDNKITFETAPSASDDVNLVFFNRQLLPEPTKNVVLDAFVCFDGTKTTFPITANGIAFTPVSVYHLFVVRHGVMQIPGKDYTVSGSTITFTTAPEAYEDELIFSFYSYDGLNQNIPLSIANYVDGVETEFALTKNYVSTTVLSTHNLMMYRNGVYQVPGKDYSVLDGSSAPYIRFTTAPVVSDDIFMVNIRQTSFEDLTSSFSQVTTSRIAYNTSTQVDDDMFFIFVNGILQVGSSYSTTYASNQYTITFGSNVDISSDNVKIYAFTTGGSSRKELDPIVVSNTSTLSYSLADGGTPITNIAGPADLIVTVDGVVQEPGVAYTVSGSTLTFNATALYQTGITINIFQVGDNSITNPNESIDYIDDNYAKTTITENGVVIKPTRYKLANGFQSFNPPNVDDLFIIRNGVVQNPTEDFVTGSGYIEFTTNVAESEDLFIMYTHGTEELSISSSGAVSSSVHRYTLSSAIGSSDYNNLVVYADGVPRFYRRGDFTVENSNTEIHLSHTTGFPPSLIFIVKYPNVTLIDDYQYCPNGSRTVFKLLYNGQNLVAANILQDADILVSQNGVVLNPDTEYDISTNRGLITFTTAPAANDVIFLVRMSRNELRTLTSVSGNTYSLSTAEPTEKENVVVFSNNKWNFAETGGFTWNTAGTQITLTTPHTTGELFAIKFFGVFNRLDQIHTPFNGSNTKFNLYDVEENFVPVGTIADDNTPDETSLLVTKNGKLLEPKVDFTLDGDIESQIVFTTAPSSGDVIAVRSVGSFDKLDTISNGTGTQFPLTKSGVDYYPNAHIERPRELENQLIVLKDGEVQSPLYDFYVDNNKIVFVNSVSFTKLVILDFRGTSSDVKVNNRFNQVSVGDELRISGETTARKVTSVLSPTVLTTESYSGNSPGNFAATTTYSNGIVTDFTMTNGGGYYENPVVIRTKGTGTSAKAVAYVKTLIGDNIVDDSTIDIQYPGNNIYTNQTAVATMYATTYKEQPLHKSTILKATKLSSNISANAETIPLANTKGMKSNAPSITVSSSSGSGADFKIFVSNNEIAQIQILNGGSGYDDRDLTLELIGGGGTGCVLEPVLNGSGTITDVIIRNPGVGYDTYKVILYYENSGVTKSETIEYTYVNSNNIDGCTRAVNAVSHDAKIESPDDVSTYTLVYFEDHDDYL